MNMTGAYKILLFIISIIVISLLLGISRLDIHTLQCSTQGYPETLSEPDLLVVAHNETDHKGPINLALVSCGGVLEEAIIMIKSALMYSNKKIHLYIFVDDANQANMKEKLSMFPPDIQKKFEYTIYDILVPQKPSPDEWLSCFKPCSTQRLFIHDMLPDVDRLIYIDTDMVFLAPVDELWDDFDKFNSVQIVGMSWHDEDDTIRTYGGNDIPFPVYQPNGLNSGSMMMDLPRMRATNWSEIITEQFMQYKDVIIYGDQDILNIFFYYKPELLFKMDCKYNYRYGYCRWDTPTCLTAVSDGVHILHGNPSTFRVKQPLSEGFKVIGDFFASYDFGKPYDIQLQQTLDELYNMTTEQEQCLSSIDFITKRMIGART